MSRAQATSDPAESSVSVGGGKTIDTYGQVTPQFLNALSTAALKAAKDGPPAAEWD